jgi:hypothetical protein
MQYLNNCFLNIYFFGSLEEFYENLIRLNFSEAELILNYLLIRNRQPFRETLILEKLVLARRNFIILIDLNIKRFRADRRRILPYI